jgi:glycosyltransferase involved in cell wall biosynthesis
VAHWPPYTGPPVSAPARPDSTSGAAGLSIVLPAYNEAANIRAAVEKGLAVGAALATEYEVIVVDDGSRDGTSSEVEALARQHYPLVRLVKHEVNVGYGAALRTGFKRSRFGLVFFTDSDNQFDMSELAQFIPMMADHDMVVGFRVNRCDPLQRSITSWFYNQLVRLLFQVKVRDVNCAFKLMSREVVQSVTIECDNFFVNTELLARARRLNFKIAEKGVRHYPRTAGETSIKLSDVPRTFTTVVTMWGRMRRSRPTQAGSRGVNELVMPSVSEFIPGSR